MTSAARQAPAAPPRAGGRTRSGLANSVRLFSVGGVDVAVHASWLVIFALVTWSLAVEYFPFAIRGISTPEAWLLGAVASLLFFASVLLHELAHSFVARASGLGVQSITLFIFGGVSNLTGEAKRPGVEFRIAIVGPVTSFVIAAVSYVIASSTDNPAIAGIAGYLAVINGLLGAFNLIPGFPLDGGRVLRSIVWSITHDLQRATDVAASVGQLVAWALMLWGFWRVLNGDVFGGIWTVAIGWFLQGAAHNAAESTRSDSVLKRLTVADVLRADPTAVRTDASVSELISRYILPGARRAVPVVDSADRLVGIVTLSDVRHVTEEQRPWVPVGQIMSGADRLVTVTPTTSLRTALDALGEGEYEQVPVVAEDGRLVGLLTRADVVRQLQIRQALATNRRAT